MKLNSGLCALSVIAMLAAAPSAMAASATVGAGVGATIGAGTGGVGADGVANGDVSATTSTDANANATVSVDGGVSQLGVNISLAGDTATSVEAFANTLSTEQQANLKTRCKQVMGSPHSATAHMRTRRPESHHPEQSRRGERASTSHA